MMTEKTLKKKYDDVLKEADSVRDSGHGKLFAKAEEDGWTQQRIAKCVGLERSRVARLMIFGRFLAFVPIGTNPENDGFKLPSNFTEWEFRGYWSETKGKKEATRFRQVVKAIEANTQPTRKRDDTIAPKIIALMSDGERRTTREISEAVGHPLEATHEALRRMHESGANGTYAEVEKWKGDGTFDKRWLVAKVDVPKSIKTNQYAHAVYKLKSLCEEGIDATDRHMAQFSPSRALGLFQAMMEILESLQPQQKGEQCSSSSNQKQSKPRKPRLKLTGT